MTVDVMCVHAISTIINKRVIYLNDNLFELCPNFLSKDVPDNVEVSQVVETLVNNPGFGTRCMMGNPIK